MMTPLRARYRSFRARGAGRWRAALWLFGWRKEAA